MNCTTCVTSTYLITSNNSCVSCDVNGYFISDTLCQECDSACLTCNGTTSSNCLSCKPGRYLENSTCLLIGHEFISTGGRIAGLTAQMQYIATTVMPVMLAERSTSAMILVGFLADVGHYKYLNVPFPENFVSFCEQMESLDLPNIFANMDSLNGGNNPTSIVEKFQFWDVSATLLDNSSFAIAKELITLAIILGLNIIVFLLKEFPKLSDFVRKVRTIFMWNAFLSYYLGDFAELQLYSMIQMRENYVSSPYTNFSFALAVIIVSTYTLLGVYFLYILNKKHSKWQVTPERPHSISAATKRSEQKWEKVPDSLEILIEDFHENPRFSRNFILVMLLETFLQVLVIFFFQDNRLAQAIMYLIIVLGFFSLSAWKRPYKSKRQMKILLLNQGNKVVMGIFAVIFGINAKVQFVSIELITGMGFILILLILIVMGINLAMALRIIIISFYQRIKEWRSRRQRAHSNLRSGNAEMTPTTNNFIDEQTPSNFARSSSDLPMDQNLQLRNRDRNGDEEHLKSAPQSKQSLILEKVHTNHDSKRNIRIWPIENISIPEIDMAKQDQ